MLRVLGTVVMFHPDEALLTNLQTYLDKVDHLLIIDNSEPSSELGDKLKTIFPKISLIRNEQNLGIATALNQAAEYGVGNGYDLLLTMDQDSSFEAGALDRMKQYVFESKELPGILAPFHCTPGGRLPVGCPATKKLGITMTSGNLLNLHAWKHCGPFEEKLFIDSVDHEYCLRLRKNDYPVTRLNTAVLFHRLGDIRYHRFLFMRFKTTNHSAKRKYYMTRNRLYVVYKYRGFDLKFVWRELSELFKAFWIIVLVEDRKLEKMNAMLRGAWHFIIGRYGKI